MSYLLDTNVISEWVKPRPDAGVVAWLHTSDEDRHHLSVITLGEIRAGVDRLSAGARHKHLDRWLTHDLADRFAGRILAVDHTVADIWGKLVAAATRRGRGLTTADGLIAATAIAHGLVLVTRNTRDFAGIVDAVENPWSG